MSTNSRLPCFDANLACRVCMKNDDDSLSIFEHVDCCRQLEFCAKIEIDRTDGLPTVICTSCFGELQIAYGFIVRCKQSDEKFRKLLKSGWANCSVKDEPLDYYEPSVIISDLPVLTKPENGSLKVEEIKSERKKKKRQRVNPQCNECGLTVKSLSALTIHMRKHTGEKPFECDECGKRFSKTDSMWNHMTKVHNIMHSNKMFVCDVCGKQFYRLSHVRTHMIVHTKEKPYECARCLKAFGQKSSLKYHMRTHTGERPFSCETCGSSFAKNCNLKRHLLLHARVKTDEIFECYQCDRKFKSKMSRGRHAVSHNRVDKREKSQTCHRKRQKEGSAKESQEKITQKEASAK